MYATLQQSDTLKPYGRAKAVTSPEGVGFRTKPKYLSASEREERENGEGGGVYATLMCGSQIQYIHMVM